MSGSLVVYFPSLAVYHLRQVLLPVAVFATFSLSQNTHRQGTYIPIVRRTGFQTPLIEEDPTWRDAQLATTPLQFPLNAAGAGSEPCANCLVRGLVVQYCKIQDNPEQTRIGSKDSQSEWGFYPHCGKRS